MRDGRRIAGLAGVLANLVLGCDGAGDLPPVQVSVAGDAAAIAAIERILAQDPQLTLPGREIAYSFRAVTPERAPDRRAPNVGPDADVYHRMPIVTPDSTVTYSMVIVRPDTTVDYRMPIVTPARPPNFSIAIVYPGPADTVAAQTDELSHALSSRIQEGLGQLGSY